MPYLFAEVGHFSFGGGVKMMSTDKIEIWAPDEDGVCHVHQRKIGDDLSEFPRKSRVRRMTKPQC